MLYALPQPYHARQSPSKVFWRTLITDTNGQPSVHPVSREYAGAFLPCFRKRLRDTAQYVDGALLSRVLERLAEDGFDVSPTGLVALSDEGDLLDDGDDTPDGSEHETVMSHSRYVRPFLTGRKYFGLSSESPRRGDEIWIVAGSRVPLALREAEKGAYRLASGTYLHGFMKGEAMKLGESFREIMLV